MSNKRMYEKKGFTKPIIKLLKKECGKNNSYSRSILHCENIPSRKLLSAVKFLPRKNLKERQNYSPRLVDFSNFARECPDAKFSGYIITEKREDERLSVDGVTYPTKCRRNGIMLRANALSKPDDERVAKNERTLWWD